MRLTLRARLALWAALATGVAVLLVAGAVLVRERVPAAGAGAAGHECAGAVQGRVEGLLRPRPDDDPLGSLLGAARVSISQADLERIADDVDRRGVDLRVIARQSGGLASVGTPSFPSGVPVALGPGLHLTGTHLILERPLRGASLQIAVDARSLREAREAFLRALVALVPLALLLSLLVGWVVAGRLLRPVRALEGAAHAIGEGGDLRRPCPARVTGTNWRGWR